MSLPSELRSSLPPSIDPEQVRAALRSPGARGSLGGETWVLDVEGRLAVLARTSIFDPLEPIVLAEGPAAVELRAGPELEIRPAEGAAFVVRPSLFEVEALAALLAGVEGRVAFTPAAEPSAAEFTPPEPARDEPVTFELAAVEPTPASSGRAEPRRDGTTLADLDVIDPDLESEAGEALAAGEYERTITAAGRLAQQSSPRERDEWFDLVEVVELMQAGDWVPAYLWTRGVREVPAQVMDELFGRLRHELERVDEPELAWAALGNRLSEAPDQRARLEAFLGRDGPTINREVAARARDFFTPLAEADDRLAQRGLARALLDLDELDAALTWIRRSLAHERFDFRARMLETQILALLAIGRSDDRELIAALQKAADDFDDRPEPLVDLADHVEYEDPAWAIELLRKALDREFDEFALLNLVELLDQSGRQGELIQEIEQAFTDPESIALVKDQLRDKLDAARRRFALSPTGDATPPAPAAAAQPNVAVAVLVALAVLAVALASLLF